MQPPLDDAIYGGGGAGEEGGEEGGDGGDGGDGGNGGVTRADKKQPGASTPCMAHSTGHISATSASIPKPVGGVQLTPNMVENSLAASCAVQAQARAGAYGISDITVEQSPSGRPNVVTNGNTLGVSAQRAAAPGHVPQLTMQLLSM